MKSSVCILLPAFNEAKDIAALLRRINLALSDSELDYKILVVDDGSTDTTVDVVHELSEHIPVSIISHDHNKGLGAAIATGFSHLANESTIVVTMDADNTQDPALIPALVEKITNGADFAIASRFVRGGKMIGVSLGRSVLSHSASAVMRTLFPIPGVRDYSCGYRAYAPHTLQALRKRFGNSFLKECGFACMVELLLKLRSVSAQGAEVPLVLRYDYKTGASKMRVARTIWRYGAVAARGVRENSVSASNYQLPQRANP